MYCETCGKKLEDHEYFNDKFDLNWNEPCMVCGKKLTDHAVTCKACGGVFCRSHSDPFEHNCPADLAPARHQQVVIPARTRREKMAAGLVSLARVLGVLLGIGLIIGGWGLAAGNRTGIHPTFPFAGMITSFTGFVVFGLAMGVKL